MDMRLSSNSTLRRKATATLGLALFLLGSNYCLVGALLPGGIEAMACMTPVAARDAQDAHGGMPACHAKPAAGDESGAPAAALPCCIALTAVAPPQFDKHAPETAAAYLVAVDDAALPFAPELTDALLRAPPESPPPSAAPRAHAAPRAPPLA